MTSAFRASSQSSLVVESDRRAAAQSRAWGGPKANERILLGLIVVSIVVAAASLAFPSTPSYDPWSWIIWGRQIVHGTLHLQSGPSWKPLPVIFTTVFGLFGQTAPNLWLVVGRGGAALASLMTFWLAARLTWWLRDTGGTAASAGGAHNRAPAGGVKIATLAPPVLAGCVAMVGLVLSSEFLSTSILGYSEGLMIAATLVAIERHIDGHRWQAFAIGTVAALDRPEFWVLWGPYGLWLMWKDRRSAPLVIGLGVLTLALWFVPQKLGGVALTQAATHDLHPTGASASQAAFPFWAEIHGQAWVLLPFRVKIADLLVLVAGAFVAVRIWRGRARGSAEPGAGGDRPGASGDRPGAGRDRAIAWMLIFALLGLLWFVIVGIETEFGFSGNTRYLVLGSALLFVSAGAGFGWAATALARFARKLAPSHRGATILAATAVLSAVFLFAPNWVGTTLISPAAVRQGQSYQSQLRENLVSLVARGGGAQRLASCGPVMTEAFQVPMVAWYLNLPFTSVQQGPTLNSAGLAPVAHGQWPRVIFQAAATPGGIVEPQSRTIRGWEAQGARYSVLHEKAMSLYTECAG